MPSNYESGIKIFIDVQINDSKVIVSIRLINDPENLHPNWYIQHINFINKRYSDDNTTVFLTFNKSDYDSLHLKYSSGLYDYISRDLFDYLQTDISYYGKIETAHETQGDNKYIITCSVIGLLIAGGALYLYSKKNKKKK